MRPAATARGGGVMHRAAEIQVGHAVEVVKTAIQELRTFRFEDLMHTLAQLKGELEWIEQRLKQGNREVAP